MKTVMCLLLVCLFSGCCVGGANSAGEPPAPREPLSRAFSGTGTQVTEPFDLATGTAYISATYPWTNQAENFFVRLERLDGEPVHSGNIASETTLYSRPAPPINLKRLVRVRQGRYVLQVRADQGNTWHLGVEQ